MGPEWQSLPLTLAQLCIDTTLRCGQSFRWQKFSDRWSCALRGRVICLRQDANHLYYRATWPAGGSAEVDDTEDLVRHYFNLGVDLEALYEKWSDADANFRKRASSFQGVRILNQDPWEALLCFICSSNNNISRISQMVHKMCKQYGLFIANVDGVDFHDFPTLVALAAAGAEPQLRSLGFGYRAKYIAATARTVAHDRSAHFLWRLRNPASPGWATPPEAIDPEARYRDAHDQLVKLTGVGPKVADCVCLMGLAWGEAVPVDTHVWQIAQRDYKYRNGGGGKGKALTKAMYTGVGDLFRELWGEYAGWAHSVLFTADLKSFAEQSATAVQIKEEGELSVVKIKEEGEPSAERIKEEGEQQVVDTVRSRKRRGNHGPKEEPKDIAVPIKRQRVTRASKVEPTVEVAPRSVSNASNIVVARSGFHASQVEVAASSIFNASQVVVASSGCHTSRVKIAGDGLKIAASNGVNASQVVIASRGFHASRVNITGGRLEVAASNGFNASQVVVASSGFHASRVKITGGRLEVTVEAADAHVSIGMGH